MNNQKKLKKKVFSFFINKDKKQKDPKQQQPQQKKTNEKDEAHPVSRLDFRVGRIIEIGPHPDPESTKLFVEKIDIGNGEIRSVASGLRGRIPEETLRDSNVIVFTNLKARPLKGFNSHGMVYLF